MRTVHCKAEIVGKLNDAGVWTDSVMVRCPYCKMAGWYLGTEEGSLELSCLHLQDRCRCPEAKDTLFVGTVVTDAENTPHRPRRKPVRKPRPKNRWDAYNVPEAKPEPLQKPIINPPHWTECYY